MAFIFQSKSGADYVNVGQAVGGREAGSGKPAVNLQTDVMLVHFLLCSIYLRMPKFGGKKFQDTNAIRLLRAIDSDPSAWNAPHIINQLSQAILLFQKEQQKSGVLYKVFADGRVDPMPRDIESPGGGYYVSSITHTKYTILDLQIRYTLYFSPLSSPVGSESQVFSLKEHLKADIMLFRYMALRAELSVDS